MERKNSAKPLEAWEIKRAGDIFIEPAFGMDYLGVSGFFGVVGTEVNTARNASLTLI